MNKYLVMNYSVVRDQLKTGDIVLFSGSGVVSNVIKWFTKSDWSHVGMVIRSDEHDMLLLWESTTLSKIKTVNGVERQGVAIRPLSEVINGYDGKVAVRKLIHKLTTDDIKILAKFREEVKGRPYEESKLELFKSAYDWIGGANDEDLSSIFCSELIAEFYQRIGIIESYTSSNEYTPADFGTLFGNQLSEIIEIERG